MKPTFDMHCIVQKGKVYVSGSTRYLFNCVCVVTDIDGTKKDFAHTCLAINHDDAGRLAWNSLKEQMHNWLLSRLKGQRLSSLNELFGMPTSKSEHTTPHLHSIK